MTPTTYCWHGPPDGYTVTLDGPATARARYYEARDGWIAALRTRVIMRCLRNDF